jgi:hypothetical protein
VREAESCLNCFGEWGTERSPTVVPSALMPSEELYGKTRQPIREPEPMQDARSVRADLDARADLA